MRVIVNRKKVKLDSVDEYLSFEMVRGKMKQKSNRKDKGRPKSKGKIIKWGRRERIGEKAQTEKKKIKWGRREREGGKGIKNKREREKKGKKRGGKRRSLD